MSTFVIADVVYRNIFVVFQEERQLENLLEIRGSWKILW